MAVVGDSHPAFLTNDAQALTQRAINGLLVRWAAFYSFVKPLYHRTRKMSSVLEKIFRKAENVNNCYQKANDLTKFGMITDMKSAKNFCF